MYFCYNSSSFDPSIFDEEFSNIVISFFRGNKKGVFRDCCLSEHLNNYVYLKTLTIIAKQT